MNLPLNVIFRTYPGYNQKKALKAFPEKELLIKYSLNSLIKSLKPYNSKLHIIIDSPNHEYVLIIKKIIENSPITSYIHTREKPFGNSESFNSCVLLANSLEKSNLFFCEDDYLIHPDLFSNFTRIFSLNNSPDYLFPFPHPDYSKLFIHKLYRGLTFFSESSNSYTRRASGCLTFFTSTEKINRDYETFKLYAEGYLGDHNMWKSFTLPLLSSSSIIKELYRNKYHKKYSLKNLFISLLKNKRPTLSSLDKPLALHLANDCMPRGLESFYDIEDPISFKKEFSNLAFDV